MNGSTSAKGFKNLAIASTIFVSALSAQAQSSSTPVFPAIPSGTILVVDTKADTVYAVTSNAFQPGGAYSASDSDGILGKVDLSTGLVTPIVTGMQSPHGALFVPLDVDENNRDK